MTEASWRRRAVLRSIASVGSLALASSTRGAVETGGDRSPTRLSEGADATESCTPGHSPGTSACTQIRNDREALTRFDATDTDLVTTFEYPCGWTTGVSSHADRIQANVGRIQIGEANAYVNVQVRNYTDPVGDGFLDTKGSEGNYDAVSYEYANESRTGLVSSADTARYGTTAHAVVPALDGDNLVHVELTSTLKGADCPQPRPDYLLVKEMLASLEPNDPGAVPSETSVIFEDQRVSAEVETQAVVVPRVHLTEGGYVAIATGDVTNGVEDVIGASSYMGAGKHENVRLGLQENIETTQKITAVAHRDTDGDYIYGFGSAAGVDEPYTAADGTPVSDTATVETVVDTPVSVTIDEGTTTSDPPPLTTTTPSSTPTLTPTKTPFPTSPPAETSTTTGGGGPGFGVWSALGGLGLGTVTALRHHLRNSQE